MKKENSNDTGTETMSENSQPLNKKIAGLLRTIAGKPAIKNYTAAVICAGGHSERMGGPTTKQMIEINGCPIVAYTLRAFQDADCIHEIIVAAKQDEVPLYDDIKQKYGITKLTHVVAGGETRQESARIGSDYVSDEAKFVAIADAARCLITPDQIDKVCHAAYQWQAASAGIRAVDTVKLCDASAFIESTPDRNRAWLAQTPQVFSLKLYRAAAYIGRDENVLVTDDNGLMEHLHVPVKMVEVSKHNMKITDPEDLVVAKAILTERAEQAEKADGE